MSVLNNDILEESWLLQETLTLHLIFFIISLPFLFSSPVFFFFFKSINLQSGDIKLSWLVGNVTLSLSLSLSLTQGERERYREIYISCTNAQKQSNRSSFHYFYLFLK